MGPTGEDFGMDFGADGEGILGRILDPMGTDFGGGGVVDGCGGWGGGVGVWGGGLVGWAGLVGWGPGDAIEILGRN